MLQTAIDCLHGTIGDIHVKTPKYLSAEATTTTPVRLTLP